jgi:hypothetical protein
MVVAMAAAYSAAAAQAPESWRAPLARDVASASWIGVDANGFGPGEKLRRLDLRRYATKGARGYWITHLRAAYVSSLDLPGADRGGRTSQVYVALLLDCDRHTWLLAGAHGAVAAGREVLLAPLRHTGLEATDVALNRITRLACRSRYALETKTAPGGAVQVDLRIP